MPAYEPPGTVEGARRASQHGLHLIDGQAGYSFEISVDPVDASDNRKVGAFAAIFQTGRYDLAETLEAIDSCREDLGFPRLGEGQG